MKIDPRPYQGSVRGGRASEESFGFNCSRDDRINKYSERSNRSPRTPCTNLVSSVATSIPPVSLFSHNDAQKTSKPSSSVTIIDYHSSSIESRARQESEIIHTELKSSKLNQIHLVPSIFDYYKNSSCEKKIEKSNLISLTASPEKIYRGKVIDHSDSPQCILPRRESIEKEKPAAKSLSPKRRTSRDSTSETRNLNRDRRKSSPHRKQKCPSPRTRKSRELSQTMVKDRVGSNPSKTRRRSSDNDRRLSPMRSRRKSSPERDRKGRDDSVSRTSRSHSRSPANYRESAEKPDNEQITHNENVDSYQKNIPEETSRKNVKVFEYINDDNGGTEELKKFDYRDDPDIRIDHYSTLKQKLGGDIDEGM